MGVSKRVTKDKAKMKHARPVTFSDADMPDNSEEYDTDYRNLIGFLKTSGQMD
jgi:hypothetical protein